MKKKIIIVMFILIGIITICLIILSRPRVVVIHPAIIENPDEEIVEMDLKLIGKFKAEDEEYVGYSKEYLMNTTYWWQAMRQSRYEHIAKERLGLEEINYDFDFEKYSYIFSYGRPFKYLRCDKTLEYMQGGYAVEYEFDMEIPYESNVVYVYETNDYFLVEVEWIK